MSKTVKITGFSMIELAIVITIASLLMGLGFAVFKNADYDNKNRQIRQQLVTIEKAILKYYQQNKRLPCPAAPDLAQTQANYAVEEFTEKNCTTSIPANTCDASKVSSNNNVYIGALPAQTLGLGKNMILDPWGRKITYAVDKVFTCANGSETAEALYSNNASLSVRESVANTEINKAAFVTISHGENQYGSYNNLGILKNHPTNNDVAETENTDNDNIFIYNDMHIIDRNLPANYDDHTNFVAPELLTIKSDSQNNDSINYGSNYGGETMLRYKARFFGSECSCEAAEVIQPPALPRPDWSPLELSQNPILWLDASDASTIIKHRISSISNAVKEWRDKSGNNNHAIQSNSFISPIYENASLNGKNVVRFSHGKRMFGTNAQYRDLYILFRIDGYSGSAHSYIFAKRNSNNALKPQYCSLKKSNIGSSHWHKGHKSKVYNNGSNTLDVCYNNTYTILRAYRGNDTNFGSSFQYHLNSTYDNFRRLFIGRIAEIIVFNSLQSNANRAKIEGYLAHKWGLSWKLPSNHAYKNSPPQSQYDPPPAEVIGEDFLPELAKKYCIK